MAPVGNNQLDSALKVVRIPHKILRVGRTHAVQNNTSMKIEIEGVEVISTNDIEEWSDMITAL